MARKKNIYLKTDFKDLLDYQQWLKDTFSNLKKNKIQLRRFTRQYIEDRIRLRPSWFGAGATFDQMEGGITEYKDPELIERIFNEVLDGLSTEFTDRIKPRKVRYNPNGLGVFVFDRAAMGMFRLKEYYSPVHDMVFDREEVRQTKSGWELIQDGSEITERWEQREDGKTKIRTSNKNVFAYYTLPDKEKQAVEIFITCGGHSDISSDRMLYSGISAIVVARLLEQARIMVKINLVIASSPDGFNSVYGGIIPIKRYDEPLDMNLIALMTSDSRFFRYDGFKGIIAFYDHFGQTAPNSLGAGVHGEQLRKAMEVVSSQEHFANNRYYFGWNFSKDSAIDTIKETMEDLNKKLMLKW